MKKDKSQTKAEPHDPEAEKSEEAVADQGDVEADAPISDDSITTSKQPDSEAAEPGPGPVEGAGPAIDDGSDSEGKKDD